MYLLYIRLISLALFFTQESPPARSAVDDVSNRQKKSHAKSEGGNEHKRCKNSKSPGSRHTAVRRRFITQVPQSEDDESEEDPEDKAENMNIDEEGLKIQRIIAAESKRFDEWKKICSKMNTSEIEAGSRWYHDYIDDNSLEERFLVKWDDLSYLHCSWETQGDLMQKVGNAKKRFSTFLRQSTKVRLLNGSYRCNDDYFNPSFTKVERILDVELPEEGNSTDNHGIIMDKSHRHFDSGTGRQFLVKWKALPYTDCTYEFERDLISNKVEYEDQVHDFYKRIKKVGRPEMSCIDCQYFHAGI